ncbi:MAG: helix-turn-helix domain-containing protein [Bacteroidota bacterium]
MNNHLPISPSNKSIAVLPFVNMSAEPENEYFSDGITEEIINALTTIQGLKVIARTSSFAFKNKNIDVRTIGDQLGVSTVLEGSVRRAQNRIRITAQLIDTNDGTHLWSKNFDRELEDIFALQDEVSLLIADQIRANFGHLNIQDHLVEVPTKNIEAYDLYLKARYQHLMWDGEGIRNSVALYEQCVALEPGFALPYFGLGYSYAMFGSWGTDKSLLLLSEAKLSAGFTLKPESDLGYFAQATLHFWGKWEFRQGFDFFRKSLAINPAYTEAEEGLCELYTAIGYFEEAHQAADNILRINPLSPNHYFTKANIYYLSREFSKAVECSEAALKINPRFTHAIALLQLCYIHLKQYDQLDQFLNDHPLVERPEECRVLYQLVHPDEAIGVDISQVSARIKEGFGGNLFPWQLFLLVHLGEKELALDFLERNVKERTGQIINFKNIPLLEPLREEPRFIQLVESVFQAQLLPPKEQQTPSTKLATTAKSLMPAPEAERILSDLEKRMNEEQLYLDNSLSLRVLAEHLGITSNKLSWLINEKTAKNFNEYLNTYRLQDFKTRALDPRNAHLTLLGLAYESGFNSKSVFNTFFKKETGLTPKAWVKNNR